MFCTWCGRQNYKWCCWQRSLWNFTPEFVKNRYRWANAYFPFWWMNA